MQRGYDVGALLTVARKKVGKMPTAKPTEKETTEARSAREKARTLGVPSDIHRFLKRAAALNDEDISKFSEPILDAFVKQKSAGRSLDDMPSESFIPPAMGFTNLGATPAFADKVVRIAAFKRASVPAFLNDDSLRQTAKAAYVSALRAAAAELGLEMVVRKK